MRVARVRRPLANAAVLEQEVVAEVADLTGVVEAILRRELDRSGFS